MARSSIGRPTLSLLVALAFVFVNDALAAARYTIGGKVSGLGTDKSVTLLNNGGNALTRTVNGSFVFSTPVASGEIYTVTVGAQPSGQKCSVANGAATVGNANVTNVAVTCANKYSIGGSITGLGTGKSVTLLNNGVNALTRTVNGSFVFSTLVASGGRYTVTVGRQPSGQKCSVANGSVLLANANITNVKVSCSAAPTYLLTDLGTLGGTNSYGWAINASRQVTGETDTTGNAASHAFVTHNGVMTDLGTLGGTYSYGSAINDSGQVTGRADTTGGSIYGATYHAFVTNNGVMTDLGTLGGTNSYGSAINDSGQVTGYADTSGDAAYHAFITINGVMTDLGTLGGINSWASAINDSGQVTGYAATSGNATHAFVTINGVMTDLGTLGGTSSIGHAINASGQVAGQAAASGDAASRAFVTHNGAMTDLGTLGGTYSWASAINDSGQVTGSAATSGNAAYHAFVTRHCVMTDLGTLGGTDSHGSAINASGQVTGDSYTTDGSQHAFLFSDGQMQDLNDLVDRTPPGGHYITLETGVAITDTGFILANGFDELIGRRVYLLSPVSQ